ncbi:MAG: CpsB/CapC family capsule biosynthesis tyrosine phosphatase, partial [Solirubrobacteraceae bacterium]
MKGRRGAAPVFYLEGMERVELHFHLLPGVDDGPPDLATAVELARAAVRDGTRLVTCTPHASFVDVAEIPERVRELRLALAHA